MRVLIAILTMLALAFPACAAPAVAISGKLELADLNMATDDALQGQPFVVEAPDVYYFYRGQYNGGPEGLSDAREKDTPTWDMYLSLNHAGPQEITVRWDLGPVPAEGRQLKLIRVFWGMDDSARNRAHLKFAARDAATQEWQDVCDYIQLPGDWAEDNSFRSLTLTFPAGEVQGFDAVRLYDGPGLVNIYPPRYVEVDVFTGPAG